jgi:hypothetical protein
LFAWKIIAVSGFWLMGKAGRWAASEAMIGAQLRWWKTFSNALKASLGGSPRAQKLLPSSRASSSTAPKMPVIIVASATPRCVKFAAQEDFRSDHPIPTCAPGSRLVVSGRREDAGQVLVAELHAHSHLSKPTRREDDVRELINRIVARFGRLDINNAGT